MSNYFDIPGLGDTGLGFSYTAPSSTMSYGSNSSGSRGYDQFGQFSDNLGSMLDFMKTNNLGKPSMGGSSFGAGDLISGLLGFLGNMQQMSIAKKQLALGREQLASSKASYAGDALARAKEIDRAYSTIQGNMVYDPRLVSPLPFYNDPAKEEIWRENLLKNNAIHEAKSQDKLLSGEGLDDYRQALASWTAAANTARPVTTTPAPAAQPVTNQTATDPRLQQQTY